MKRRNFIKSLAITAIAAPVVLSAKHSANTSVSQSFEKREDMFIEYGAASFDVSGNCEIITQLKHVNFAQAVYAGNDHGPVFSSIVVNGREISVRFEGVPNLRFFYQLYGR